MSKVNLLVKFELLPEASDSAHKILNEFHEASKKDPGFEYMHIMRDTDNPSQIFIIESWQSQRDFETHIATRHFLDFGAAIQEHSSSMTIKTLATLD